MVIKSDTTNPKVAVETGALLGPTVNQLSQGDIAIPLGTCVTNGIAGLTLGGGIGFMVREYGLTLDSVLKFKIVLANGKQTTASARKNADLFWALRGAGGGNFGVVTDIIYKPIKLEYVTIFVMNFRFKDAKVVLKTWQKWAPHVITQLSSEFDIHNRYQPVIVTGQLLPLKNKKMTKLNCTLC